MRTRSVIAAAASAAITGVGLAGTATASGPDACEGVSGCEIISRSDIDGDGRGDSTGMNRRAYGGGERTTIRTVTADGERLMTITDSDFEVSGDRHRGTARIDGAPGYELVILDETGAHTAYNRVITYRDGRLTTLRDPHHEWRWITDGSAWSSLGYRRVDESSLGVQMYASKALNTNFDDRWDQELLRSRWAGDHWTMVKKYDREVGVRTVQVYGGWNIHWMRHGI